MDPGNHPAYEPAACSGQSGSETDDYAVEEDERGNYVRAFIDRTNKRLEIVQYSARDWEKVIYWLEEAADRHALGKILFNARRSENHVLGNFGYILEGIIPAFFAGEDALCYSRFTDPDRSQSRYYDQEEKLLQGIFRDRHREENKKLPEGFRVAKITREQVGELVELYRGIFSSYPSPLLEPEYVSKMMLSHVTFFGVLTGGKIVSAASAEADPPNGNAEITDCATLPEHRGKGLLRSLIRKLEKEMPALQISSLYSLARAGSYGMNAALHRLGYEYRGRFINNCHIGGRFEDMNLWVKIL